DPVTPGQRLVSELLWGYLQLGFVQVRKSATFYGFVGLFDQILGSLIISFEDEEVVMRKRTQRCAPASMLVLLTGLVMILGPAVSTSWAQVVKGAIEGSVVDPTGAVVPGAEIIVLDPATGATGKAVSDATGAFRIPLLAVGTYNVTVTMKGFRKLEVTGVGVTSAATTPVGRLQLEVGQTTTTVEV